MSRLGDILSLTAVKRCLNSEVFTKSEKHIRRVSEAESGGPEYGVEGLDKGVCYLLDK